jgi:hypothetical protein
MFVLGPSASQPPRAPTQPLEPSLSQQLDLPELSSHATIGRNSQFHNLTDEDREMLGGIEYRSLKLLLKIVTGKSSSSSHSQDNLTEQGTSSDYTSSAQSAWSVGSSTQTPSTANTLPNAAKETSGGESAVYLICTMLRK